MIAFLRAKRDGLLKRDTWLPNIISGVIVGIIALPLAMAFAIASGVKPEQGIYTAIIAGFCVSAFGGSRLQIAGPTGAFIVLLANIAATYGIDGLQIATIMAGVMLLFLGFTRLGSVIKFIPSPVIVGFTAGIAVIVWIGQWRDFFGLPKVTGEHFHQKFLHLLQVLPQLNLTTTSFSCLALMLVLISPKLRGIKRIPGPLVALCVATALQTFFQFKGVATIGSAFGGIPQGFPSLHGFDISFSRITELLSPAFAIAMLAAIESLLSAVIADGMCGTRHDSNQELIGQGLANVVAPFFGGIASTGAIARTAANIRNGGSNPIAGIVHAATLLAIVLFCAPMAASIPLGALAAILFVVAWNMSDIPHAIKMIKRAPIADVVILIVTMLLTIFVDLIVAVNIGVLLAILHFLRKMAGSVEVVSIGEEELHKEFANLKQTSLPENVLVYALKGPFFFAAAEDLYKTLENKHSAPRLLIIRLNLVPFIDITGLQALEKLILGLHKRQIQVILTAPNEIVKKKLEKAGIIQLIGLENFFQDCYQAFLDVLPLTKRKLNDAALV